VRVHSGEEKREPVRGRRKNGRGGKGGMMFGECGRRRAMPVRHEESMSRRRSR
jgi:hypothetical protein